jgi:hypothetical protein
VLTTYLQTALAVMPIMGRALRETLVKTDEVASSVEAHLMELL